MYVYHLPYLERKELCCVLDQQNKWEELAGTHMKFDVSEMQMLKRQIYCGNSPTEELLTMWGHQNHTVLELFVLLGRMQHYQAMTVIKKFVDQDYHQLILNNDGNAINHALKNLTINNKDFKIPQENFNCSDKILNVPQKQINLLAVRPRLMLNNNAVAQVVSRENNNEANDNKLLLKPRSPLPLGRIGNSKTLTVSDISTVAESAGAIPQIPYDDLRKSTNDWNPATILGKGGFGTVFKGTWKCTQVAIKRIEQKENNPESHTEQIKQSITELHCLNAYRHDNILPVYGYSIGGPQPCLVYQYMSGGCLEHRLRTREMSKVLKWDTRLNIAIGTARGLQYLHTIGEKPLIHGDIKSANILLDPNDIPRIGDFGLAREGPQSNYTHIKVSRIHGTRPYLPDEFLRAKKFSTKVDTYSFGVVLFEIATALNAYSERRENKFLKDHVVNYEGDIMDLKDPRVLNGDSCFRGLIEIGALCVNKRAKERPEMVSVLMKLENVVP